MALAVTLNSIDITRRKIRRTYTALPSGSYSTGGDTLNMTVITNTVGLPRRFPPPLKLPAQHNIIQRNAPVGYDFEILQNATSPTLANFLLKVYSSGGTEISASTYPTGLLTDGFIFTIETPTKDG